MALFRITVKQNHHCNNIRLESTGGGRTMRHQLLKTNPRGTNCTIKFSGFNDCQWAWGSNQTPQRNLPLCEINGGAIVTNDEELAERVESLYELPPDTVEQAAGKLLKEFMLILKMY